MAIDPSAIARALTGDTKPLEEAQEYLARFDAAVRRGVPERALLTVLHAKVERGEAWQAVGTWQTGRGLYVLSGPYGTGKTVAAVRWAAVTGATWTTAARAWEADRQAELARCKALVVDEVGGPGSTGELQASRLASLLVQRHADRLATLLTMNMDRRGFSEIYDGEVTGGRLWDRIDEDGEWRVVTQRMRSPGTRPPTERNDAAKALCRLWARVESVARGAPDDGCCAELQAALKLDSWDVFGAVVQQMAIAQQLQAAVRRFGREESAA